MRRLFIGLTLTLVAGIATRAHLDAQMPPQGRGGGPGQGTPAAPPADPIPTTAASIMLNPPAYLGKVVSVTASVARPLTATAFVIDQNRNPAQGEILVIAPAIVKMPPADAYVTVVGDLVPFDPAAVAAKFATYKLDVPADVLAKFQGKPAILATAVVGSNLADLTKRPPAPMSPEDTKLSALMQQISPASAALRTAIAASDAATVKARTAELKKLFGDVQDVFKGLSLMTAMLYANDAIKQTDAAAAAAAAGNWPEVTAASTNLSAACTTCHNAHRERQDDGTFRLKK
jgi:hypothetical protein